jgi:hypothetical protein
MNDLFKNAPRTTEGNSPLAATDRRPRIAGNQVYDEVCFPAGSRMTEVAGDGPPPSPKDGNDYGPPSPDTQFTVHSTRGPTGPGNARPPSATGRLVVPRCNNQPHKPASTDSVRTEPAARKIEAS